ncbi:MAG: hypothetical protein ABIH71_01940 [Candidatus Omnitrophota bacterium]
MGAVTGAVGAWSDSWNAKHNKTAITADTKSEQTAKTRPEDIQAPIDTGRAEGGPAGAINGAVETAKQNSNVDISTVELEAIVISKKTSQVRTNWKTISIGVGTAVTGILTIVGSVVAGTSATVASAGTGLCPAVCYAGAGVVNGLIFFSIGMGDIAVGISGGDSVLTPAIKAIYGADPPEARAVNPF